MKVSIESFSIILITVMFLVFKSWDVVFILSFIPLLAFFRHFKLVLKRNDLIYIAICLIFFNTAMIHYDIKEFIRNGFIFIFALYFYFEAKYFSFRDIERVTKAIICVLVLYVAVLIIYNFYEYNQILAHQRRYVLHEFVIFGEPYPETYGVTNLVLYINLITALCVILYIKSDSYFYLLLALITNISIVITQGKSQALFLLLIIVIVILKMTYSLNRLNRIIVMTTFIVVSSTCIFVSVKSGVFTNTDVRAIRYDTSSLGRLYYNALGIEHLMQKPFGNYLLYTDNRFALNKLDPRKSENRNYHNTFLELFNRFGVQFGIYLGVILLFFFSMFFSLSSYNNKLISAVLFLFIFQNFNIESVFTEKVILFSFFFMTGLLFKQYELNRRGL